ncbi:MAG: hypothetical protein RLZZ74_3040 [Cyanobacteriota bacterium]|jgi:hypothetical protein
MSEGLRENYPMQRLSLSSLSLIKLSPKGYAKRYALAFPSVSLKPIAF